MRVFLTGVVLIIGACLPALAEDQLDLCDTHDWFQLRERVAVGGASLLCKGAVDASFEKRAAAESELTEVIRQLPRSASSYRAHEILAVMFFREGRYRKAAEQIDQMLAEKPHAKDAQAMHSLFAVLSQYADLIIASSEPSTLRSETIEDNLFIPVTANGVSATYIVDTGANISVLSESEARRLGLKMKETSTKATDISGTKAAARVVEVPDMWIGKTHLKHVAFLVYPDESEPFVDEPEGHKGVLGIQVMLALGSFRIGKGNRFDIQDGFSLASDKAVPLAFDGAMPVTQMSLGVKSLIFTFDTGASHTILGPVFADAFPDLMRTAAKKDYKLTGVSGSTNQKSVVLASLRFLLGKEVELAPATILLKAAFLNGGWAAGNLGFDLISQTIPLTIDFRAMQLSVEDR